MAREMKLVLTDDFDGSVAAETVTFALDQTAYEIELSNDNAAKLRNALAPFIEKARKVPFKRATGGRSASTAKSGGSIPTAKVREWAQATGREVSERGRISADVIAAYKEAHK